MNMSKLIAVAAATLAGGVFADPVYTRHGEDGRGSDPIGGVRVVE